MLVTDDEPTFSNLAVELILIFTLALCPRSFANDVQWQLFSSGRNDYDDRQ
jgi:hypothetical protein